MSAASTTILWYVRIDDETRVPGRQIVTHKERERIRRATASILRTLPNGTSLYPSEKAGTIGVTIPGDQIEHLDEVDAAFLSAGYKRDPYAPELDSGSVR